MNQQQQWLFETPSVLEASSSAATSLSSRTIRETVSGFSRYSNVIPSQERAKIARIAQLIVQSHRSGHPIRTVQLVGHADRDVQRGANFEKKMSGDRALAVQKSLIAAINQPAISRQIIWKHTAAGASQRLVPNARTEADRQRNRRVEMTLISQAEPPPPNPKRFYLRVPYNRIVGSRVGIVHPALTRSQKRTTAFRSLNGAIAGLPIANVREDVMNAMNRLHLLWSMNNADYAVEYPVVASLPPGSTLDEKLIPLTVNAIGRNQEPTLHHEVAKYFLNQPLTQPVGRNLPNLKADVLMLQNSLRALQLLNPSDYIAERAAVMPLTSVTDPDRVMPKTLEALTRLKEKIASFQLGWKPLQADELEAGGDRYGGRTFDFTITTRCFIPGQGEQEIPHLVSIFIPRQVTPDINNVHVFFSPRAAAGDTGRNDVLVQGLRSAADRSNWILIGVSGFKNKLGDGWRTINDSAIAECLRWVGRSPKISAVRLSGHSRGVLGLSKTLELGLIASPIDRIHILDAPELFQRGGKNVIAYRVNVRKSVPGAIHRNLNPGCMRAIGYSRLIKNAMLTCPSLPIPPEIKKQLLPILDRGCFSTAPPTTLTGCLKNITEFCGENKKAINKIIQQEQGSNGLHTFVEKNNLLRKPRCSREESDLPLCFREVFTPRCPREKDAIIPGIYSHHLFVAEIAHELFNP